MITAKKINSNRWIVRYRARPVYSPRGVHSIQRHYNNYIREDDIVKLVLTIL